MKKPRKNHGKYTMIPSVPIREKLLALRLIMQSDETRFRLLSEGPAVLNMKSLDDRVSRIEGMER